MGGKRNFQLIPTNIPYNIINHSYILSLAWRESGRWIKPDLLWLKYTWPASAAGWLNQNSNIFWLYHPCKAFRSVSLGRFCQAKVSAPPFIADTFAHLSHNTHLWVMSLAVQQMGVNGISGTGDVIFMKFGVFAIYVKIFWNLTFSVGHIIVTMATRISLAMGIASCQKVWADLLLGIYICDHISSVRTQLGAIRVFWLVI